MQSGTSTKDWIIWGTGELCERFWRELPFQARVACFVDSNKTGEKHKLPLIAPPELTSQSFERLYICSSWVNDIVAECLDLGIPQGKIYVVMARSLEVVPLEQFDELTPGHFHYLPWKKQLPEIQLSLSGDIVHPDVYKDLVKSISYCFISSVEGDFAEFGTCSGYTASLIAYAINFYSSRLHKHEQAHGISARNLCLFDSFEGFPEATMAQDIESPHVASGMWGAGTAKGLNRNELQSLVTHYLPLERVAIYEGWYKNTLFDIEPGRLFAFVHMDCDLYESTIDVLRYLFKHRHIAQGAMLLFDNWYCNKASAEFAEQRAWLTLCEEFNVNYKDLGIYACVGNRLIIHSYSEKHN